MANSKWYGSVNNRIGERCKEPDEITVGMGATEFFWSDRHAYEVVEVIDQKHIGIREYDVKHVGEPYTQNWELISNPGRPVIHLTKRGKYWYTVCTLTAEEVADFDEWDIDHKMWFWHSGLDLDTIRAKGKQTKYHKKNIRVGFADYYYDYEF